MAMLRRLRLAVVSVRELVRKCNRIVFVLGNAERIKDSPHFLGERVFAVGVEVTIYTTVKAVVECHFSVERPATAWSLLTGTIATYFTVTTAPTLGVEAVVKINVR
jgi:hypothetical protein